MPLAGYPIEIGMRETLKELKKSPSFEKNTFYVECEDKNVIIEPEGLNGFKKNCYITIAS
jgi:hypothetical protein